ncbi:MAG: protoheme IX farnesyltransferase [Myxococcales bacterium]|nr:protoheme IX farnesyltransferase [Myxococcales bacterium]
MNASPAAAARFSRSADAEGLRDSRPAYAIVPSTRDRLRGYLSMTRPSVVGLVFFTGVPALAIDGFGWPGWARSSTILLGIALCAAASSVFNAWLERASDALMERTRTRPLPTGLIEPRAALLWGMVLLVGGVGTLFAIGGMPGALAGAATVAFYVFVYTIWLKPRTPLNIVIGGAAGAAPPLIVDACLTGGIGLMSLTLFTLVFLWTPPHFWAIALFRKEDYARAGFPMLPNTHGDAATRRRIVLYALCLVPFALLPALTRNLSLAYGAFALVVSLWFVWECVELLRKADVARARRTFFASLLYLHLLFTGMTVDLLLLRT